MVFVTWKHLNMFFDLNKIKLCLKSLQEISSLKAKSSQFVNNKSKASIKFKENLKS